MVVPIGLSMPKPFFTTCYGFVRLSMLLARSIFFVSLLCILCECGHRFCQDNEHVDGYWKYTYNSSTAKKAYHCCGADSRDHLHNPGLCGWTSLGGLEKHRGWDDPSIVPHTGGHACYCDREEGRTSVNRRERYTWTPFTCKLRSWNANDFCLLLANRTFLFFGDSTMQQSAHSVMNLVHTNNGGCNQFLAFARTHNENFQDLYEKVSEFKPSFVMFNYGAHAHSSEDMNIIFRNILHTLKSKDYKDLLERFNMTKSIKYLWRTSHPNHGDCTAYNKPGPYQIFNSTHDYYYPNGQFMKKDEMIRSFAESHGHTIVDMTPLYYRPDAHPYYHEWSERTGRMETLSDCLHYCMPGPMDILANLLYNRLKLKEI